MRPMYSASCPVLLLIYALSTTSATYIPWNRQAPVADVSAIPRDESNDVEVELNPVPHRRHKPIFRNDADVYRYLKGLGRQLMIWKCRNAIQSYWHYKPIPYIDLYCDVIGTMKTVAWSYRGRKIAGTGVELGVSDVSRFSYTIMTHYDTGQYYSSWLDFRLRIYNATQEDSGIYRFRVTSPSGDVDHRLVYVDISAPPPPPTTTPTDIVTSGFVVTEPEVDPKDAGRRKQSGKAARRRRLRKMRRRRKRLERRQRRGSVFSVSTDDTGTFFDGTKGS